MRRNSGIIGKHQQITLNNAPGVHEIFDHYNCKVDNAWPIVKKATSITGDNGSNFDENVTTTFTVQTEGFDDGDTVYYSIATVSGPALTSADFSAGAITGSFTVNSSGVGTIIITPIGDGVAESNTCKIQIRRDSISGSIIGESATFTMADGDLSVEGQVVFTSFNTTLNTDVSWTVPTGVSQISAVCVGGGGGGGGNNGTSGPGSSGGGGGGLAYGTFPVTAGETLTIRVGSGGAAGGTNTQPTSGSNTQIKRGATVLLQGSGGSAGVSNSTTAAGGSGGGSTGTERDGGGTGGAGGTAQNNGAGAGGGGAAGYSGNGGQGAGAGTAITAGNGGGGGGGNNNNGASSANAEQNGGGVGLYGQGTNGSTNATPSAKMGSYNLSPSTGDGRQTVATSLQSGTYGGGGGAIEDDTSSAGHAGGNGGIRIIWGSGRTYPSTNVADV